ncbi:MarR family winged helix-turn-helix transcriptional regulator [Deinococcus hohokamensis]|uniref:MarR family winged helix-turn-helix transcriptional regulator n=1 Tax=Deinococcus hohokamensis TaxID=309883 RepID=A0ABV9I3Z4_9DEIO
MKRLHRHISSRVMRGMQAELIDLDLSFSQMTALHQLRAGGGMTVTELSARTRLSVPAASHLVERLVQRGLAGREENPDNRREKLVRLTPAGLEVLGSMDRNFVTAYVSTFAPLQPATIRAATQTLVALLEELEPQDPCTPTALKEIP